MEERKLTFFVSDVHLGADVNDTAAREERFVRFLRSIPAARTEALYLLGDIWDFWYEYHDVVPKGSERVLAAITDLIAAGVKVFFFQGNHDMWTFGYLESLGIRVLQQPCLVDIQGRTFCLGHGDGLGPGNRGYKLMRRVFRSRWAQTLFSALHPRIAFALARGWSMSRHRRHTSPYVFKGTDEPLYKFAERFSQEHHVDYFIFGHFHTPVDMTLPGGAHLVVLDCWLKESCRPVVYFDGSLVGVGNVPVTA